MKSYKNEAVNFCKLNYIIRVLASTNIGKTVYSMVKSDPYKCCICYVDMSKQVVITEQLAESVWGCDAKQLWPPKGF